MDNKTLKKMVLAIVEELDYDLSKELDPKYSDDPEDAKERLNRLMNVAKKFVDVDVLTEDDTEEMREELLNYDFEK